MNFDDCAFAFSMPIFGRLHTKVRQATKCVWFLK